MRVQVRDVTVQAATGAQHSDAFAEAGVLAALQSRYVVPAEAAALVPKALQQSKPSGARDTLATPLEWTCPSDRESALKLQCLGCPLFITAFELLLPMMPGCAPPRCCI